MTSSPKDTQLSENFEEIERKPIEDRDYDLLGEKYKFIRDLTPEQLVDIPYAQYKLWGFNDDEICELKSRLEEGNSFETAFEYFEHSEIFKQIKFNVKAIDGLTDGGIDVGGITEIFGEAGSGKTQLCLQMSLNVQLPKEIGGLYGKAVYISTEKIFPTNRLESIAAALKRKFSDSTEIQEINFLENIFTYEIFDNRDQVNLLSSFLDNEFLDILYQQPKVKLVVIDSIAGIFRTETSYVERANVMRSIVLNLEKLAEIYDFAIVTTNHLTSVPNDTGETEEIAALGVTWDTMVGTRLKVRNTQKYAPSRVRQIEVTYSPRLPCKTAKFIVTENGVEDVPDCGNKS